MHHYEKHGDSPNTDISCNEFRNLVRERDVIDLGFPGPAFTWSNNAVQSTPIFERLDRVVCNTEWRLLSPDAAVLHLPRIDSDHAPIILNTMRKPPKRRPNYKFEFYWTDHPQFNDIIEDKWDNSSGNMISRLDTLGKCLMKWSKDTFGDTKIEIEIERQKLVELQTTWLIQGKKRRQSVRRLPVWRREIECSGNKSKWIPATEKIPSRKGFSMVKEDSDKGAHSHPTFLSSALILYLALLTGWNETGSTVVIR
ncbi:uncharacterized protein LOC113349241 isoform X2 [Papaver somniferum]|uniref:uncharacterized protein LOC113349241 isoform X2 n=1 Tax=Papaver somniferum TaxID=3469 RepID=UPI000E704A9E|nr:uncharacterized protein LOC113349241 isoform X2 [Papaver somniferum]